MCHFTLYIVMAAALNTAIISTGDCLIMKRVLAIALILGMAGGCATQQSFKIPSSKTRGEFLLDREVCENFSGYRGGYFDSGPLILLFPFAMSFDLMEGNHQKDFQKCMAERGYECTGRCWDMNTAATNTTRPTSPAEK